MRYASCTPSCRSGASLGRSASTSLTSSTSRISRPASSSSRTTSRTSRRRSGPSTSRRSTTWCVRCSTAGASRMTMTGGCSTLTARLGWRRASWRVALSSLRGIVSPRARTSKPIASSSSRSLWSITQRSSGCTPTRISCSARRRRGRSSPPSSTSHRRIRAAAAASRARMSCCGRWRGWRLSCRQTIGETTSKRASKLLAGRSRSTFASRRRLIGCRKSSPW
mmetsp:Transcript_37244/g.84359  ORF Transcript_37244/g.84359 Transcript_37244/m.84359 type:complete len:223 (-) Transcript_37244:961-1629(-)